MRHIIILTDEDLDALRNNKMVQVNSRHIGADVYLTTQKGFEIDIKNDMDIFDQGCGTCKYINKGFYEEPCFSCDIRLGNNKWEPKDNNGGDK